MAGGNTAIVIDCGSGSCRAGFGGEESPRVVITSLQYSNENEVYPIQRGVVKNWEAMEKLLQRLLEKLNVSVEQRSVLITKPANASKDHVEKLTDLLFKSFKASSVFVAYEPTICCYAVGKLAGLVCGSGDGLSYAVPVHEGFAIPSATVCLEYGGSDLDAYMNKLLGKKGNTLSNFAAREVKEALGYVALDYKKESLVKEEKSFELSDHQVVNVSSEKVQCPEALFQPSFMEKKYDGIHRVIYNAIMKCDKKIQEGLFSSIILSGGSTLFPGFKERLEKELSSLAPSATIHVIASHHRKESAWIGASVLSVHDKFQEMWLTRKEYDEGGAEIIHKKFV